MKLPWLFLQIHQHQLKVAFDRYGSVFKIIPKEPIGRVTLGLPTIVDSCVTFVTIRAVEQHGVFSFEAYSAADLAVATDWAKRHRDTPPEEL